MNLTVQFQSKSTTFTVQSKTQIPFLLQKNYNLSTDSKLHEFKLLTVEDGYRLVILESSSLNDMELFMGDYEYESRNTPMELIKPLPSV